MDNLVKLKIIKIFLKILKLKKERFLFLIKYIPDHYLNQHQNNLLKKEDLTLSFPI